jgi:hypothetical protein
MATIKLRELPYYTGTVSLEGSTYRLTVKWNETTAKWYMDIKSVVGSVDIKGIALLTGIELLSPYGYALKFGNLRIVDNSEANEDPLYEGMGDRWTLEYSELVS